ncbi:two-component system regulatory protein YycI [Holzapfeliella sp. He02]|uniref:Two-component system regulatory protein YycI n=1 Tax=Holzapfeliella saturejae TaxID=3082953 RepID=A0ABU8SEQ8_9LACO
MDFRKIEYIFIAVFLFINIFLSISVQNPPFFENSAANSNDNTINSIQKDNISLPELSTTTDESQYLATRNLNSLANYNQYLKNQRVSYDTDKNVLTSQLNQVIHYQKESVANDLAQFMRNSENVIYGSEYVYASELSTDTEVVFVQQLNLGQSKQMTGLIYDDKSQIRFQIKGNNITGYTQSYVSDLAQIGEKQATISQQSAVINLYSQKSISNNSKVLFLKLGYSPLYNTTIRGSEIYVPTWYVGVVTNNDNRFFVKEVNAFDGKVMN